MATIQFSGLNSGLDTKSIIDALMQEKQARLTNIQGNETTVKNQQAAIVKLKAALNDFLTKVKALTVSNAASGHTATSQSTALTATASTSATPGQYQVSVDRLATATKATSTSAIGPQITAGSATTAMSSLPLPGTVTAGSVGIVVDGVIVHATIGDPATTSLQDAMDAIASAIRTQLTAEGESASVTAQVVNNKVEIDVAGATSSHAVRFSVGGDTSNFLTIAGLDAQAATLSDATPISGTSALGVVRTQAALDAAGLTGLTSTTTGAISINGISIAYDTTVNSLATVLSRINASQAGVVASLDRAGDRIVLTQKSGGSAPIDISDTTGTLAAALDLAPGTTNAQVLGTTAQVTVDGRTVTANTNHVTTAIPGVAMDLVSLTTGATTLTVGVDHAAAQTALSDLVTSYNALADLVDTDTAHQPGGTASVLEGDATVSNLARSLRTLLMTPSTSLSGGITSLSDLGVSFGAIGSDPKSTRRLVLDTAKLDTALDQDPDRVSALLGSSAGVLKPVADAVTKMVSSTGVIGVRSDSLDTRLRSLTSDEKDEQDRLDTYQASLEAKFARLEATLSQLSSMSSAFAQQASQTSSSSN